MKFYSTVRRIAKGKDRNEVEFFAKFILCSNNELNPISIGQGETRYWVRKIPVLTHDNPNLLSEMKKELTHFLHFLLNRKLSTPWESRMWFRHDLLVTPALCQIINYNRSKAEAEMLQIINEIMANEKLTELSFCIGDMVAMLDIRGIKTEHAHIRKILQHNWELKPKEPTHYTSYCLTFDGDVKSSPKIGRCYTVDNSRNDLFLLLC